MVGCCPVVELRQYTLRPGQREALVALFDREFVESQVAVGMQIVGQFRDLDRSERFVWIRGFPDMVRRREALEAFYGGPVWAAHSQTANATMLDVDDVLLLRPATPTSGFGPLPPRPPRSVPATLPRQPTPVAPPTPGAEPQPTSRRAMPTPGALVVATICSLDRPADAAVVEHRVLPRLRAAGASPLATFVEEPAQNTFPALPVRTGEHVVVWLHRFPADGEADAMAGAVADRLRQVRDLADLVPHLIAPPTQLRLQPTPRSLLR